MFNYNLYKHLPKQLRVEKYANFFSEVKEKLAIAGLTFDDSCDVCDLILFLPVDKIPVRKKYMGVYKKTGRDTYYSKIVKDGKYIYIGSFKTPDDAALAYDEKCYELYEDLDKLNFPELFKE